jgi:hypothetical protein
MIGQKNERNEMNPYENLIQIAHNIVINFSNRNETRLECETLMYMSACEMLNTYFKMNSVTFQRVMNENPETTA